MTEELKNRISKIKMLVLDVDGILTDGTLIVNADGTETKNFNSLDGHGIRLMKRAGCKVAFLSGRFSDPTTVRAAQLEVDYCFQDKHFKLPVLNELAQTENITLENIAYMGDDLPDLPIIRAVGFAATVPNAAPEVKLHAHFITEKTGGNGAVREVIELILKINGKWDSIMKRYLE